LAVHLHEIVVKAGYPYPRSRDGSDSEFVDLTATSAAQLLAQAATQSLAYEFPQPAPSELAAEILDAFKVLGEDARFVTNRDGAFWFPLSTATFDLGVIGFNRTHGFIFWVEDED
jgi:hypothetical protein